LCGLLSGLCERWKQYGCERKDGNKSADEVHANLLFRLSGVVTFMKGAENR
jgi:hypothetical protein